MEIVKSPLAFSSFQGSRKLCSSQGVWWGNIWCFPSYRNCLPAPSETAMEKPTKCQLVTCGESELFPCGVYAPEHVDRVAEEAVVWVQNVPFEPGLRRCCGITWFEWGQIWVWCTLQSLARMRTCFTGSEAAKEKNPGGCSFRVLKGNHQHAPGTGPGMCLC